MTYDLSTDAGKVRLLCTDTDPSFQLFTDPEIDAFLSIEGSSVRRAAALALETISSNEVLIQKAIKVSNLQTNGPAVAKELRERAAALRAQAAEDDAADGALFDYAEYSFDPFSTEERRWNQALRGLI